jgi:NADH dehydrogenase FAD-containing subunit
MQADDSSILTSRRHRVVIAGAGFGGLFAARRCGADVDVTVIDRRFA